MSAQDEPRRDATVESTLRARRYLIDGVVQGVGFRFFVLRRALAAGLNGWVRNLDDGRVEVYAEGPGEDLGKLEEDLRRGPRGARIGRIDITNEAATSLRDGFRIR